MHQPLGDQIWTAEAPLRFFGLQLGCRMTIVRLNGGHLWVHSPIAVCDALHAIPREGNVAFIVAPNKLHHLHVLDFLDSFPKAKVYACQTLAEKRPDLPIEQDIEEGVRYPWSDEIDTHLVKGLRYLNEVVFYHRSSKTLILTDLGFNIGSDKPLFTRLFSRINGVYKRFACPREIKFCLVKSRSEFKSSIMHIATWDFDKIILAHGDIVTSHAKDRFRQAFAIDRVSDSQPISDQ